MTIVLLEIEEDVINGGIGMAVIGIFDKKGVLIERKTVSGKVFDRRFKYSKREELKLVPANWDFEAR